jgi:hypothetical protein
MPNNFSARLDRIETAVAARADTGPKLVCPGGEALLHGSPEWRAAADTGELAGRMVWTCDEKPPENPIMG